MSNHTKLRSVIVMGVSGSGKSTIGAALAQALTDIGEQAEFIDADDLHPASNKEKMRHGTPLTDTDRWPWLDICAAKIAAVEATGKRCVMANPALRRVYRDRLRRAASDLFFASLDGSREVIAERQTLRHHEFMANSLLDSQFATLERPDADEATAVIPIQGSMHETVVAILSALKRGEVH